MTALPTTLDTALHVSSTSLMAYKLCLDLERNAKTDRDTVYARVLGCLMLLAPISREVTAAVNLCQAQGRADWDLLSDLGRAFVYFLIAPFRKPEDITPSLSPGWDSDTESGYDETAVKARREVKKQAYIRDGFRCVLSGYYDWDTPEHPSINREELSRNDLARNHPAHKSILAILQNFGYSAGNPQGFPYHYNSLQNVITICRTAQICLNRLLLWLEPPQDSHDLNTCVVHGEGGIFGIYKPGTIFTFTTPDPVKLPTPSSQLIGLHAFVSKLANLSGARELVDNLQLEMEGLGELVRLRNPTWDVGGNGAQGEQGPVSAELLSFALSARLTR
ncbi:hypothetical protein D9758_011259 [Tetrapyrgos nigripes]|uniref:HNH nuclease domain-containing protein n=1 Tax=Tetrapyrgos nigripes TaxID=182062 RepID=A0A8H5CUP7_9AGAR|nr:hypothetical protein D9758_011259 [Tetrapyrgos nigripes]